MKEFESGFRVHQYGETDLGLEQIGVHLREGSDPVTLWSLHEPQSIFCTPMDLWFDFLSLFHVIPDTQFTFEVMNGVGKSFLLSTSGLMKPGEL